MAELWGILRIGLLNRKNFMRRYSSQSFFYSLLATLIITIVLSSLPPETDATFAPKFVWAAVNKSLDEDRLTIVDANNEKVKIKSCAKLVMFNKWSEDYIQGNHSGRVILVNITDATFSSQEIVSEVKDRIDAINPGACVPCIVVISIVNVSSMPQEKYYGQWKSEQQGPLGAKYWMEEENKFQNYKLTLSQELVKLLQFKTPIQVRHLVLVRLTERKDQLTKCHGKKYTKYPRRLVSLWEQVLFDHFKEARVIQGTIEKGSSEHTLSSGKESGNWVWMCEEIIRRLELQERCKQGVIPEEKCQRFESAGNFSTALVDMTNKDMCGVYRPRS